jgi:hypothetical protein
MDLLVHHSDNTSTPTITEWEVEGNIVNSCCVDQTRRHGTMFFNSTSSLHTHTEVAMRTPTRTPKLNRVPEKASSSSTLQHLRRREMDGVESSHLLKGMFLMPPTDLDAVDDAYGSSDCPAVAATRRYPKVRLAPRRMTDRHDEGVHFSHCFRPVINHKEDDIQCLPLMSKYGSFPSVTAALLDNSVVVPQQQQQHSHEANHRGKDIGTIPSVRLRPRRRSRTRSSQEIASMVVSVTSAPTSKGAISSSFPKDDNRNNPTLVSVPEDVLGIVSSTSSSSSLLPVAAHHHPRICIIERTDSVDAKELGVDDVMNQQQTNLLLGTIGDGLVPQAILLPIF